MDGESDGGGLAGQHVWWQRPKAMSYLHSRNIYTKNHKS